RRPRGRGRRAAPPGGSPGDGRRRGHPARAAQPRVRSLRGHQAARTRARAGPGPSHRGGAPRSPSGRQHARQRYGLQRLSPDPSPAEPGRDPVPASRLALRDLAMTSARILVADDEPSMRWLLERVLRQAGHTVTVVEDGASALTLAAAEPFDLAFVDVRMPDV